MKIILYILKSVSLGLLFILQVHCSGGVSQPFDLDPVENTISEDAPIGDGEVAIADSDWNTTAVRKVLHTFAYGGFASDTQIQNWADMAPGEAVVQMLTLDTINPLVSPIEAGDPIDQHDGSLAGLSHLWSTNNSSNLVPADKRERFAELNWSSPEYTWFQALSTRGLNPVRQRVALFETNYHMAVNQDAGVGNRQIYSYYDDIMSYLAAKAFYQDVLSSAALSAAVATQYNHRHNQFIDAKFEGNEDFAREYHQLFFGILGVDDPEYHELVTIRNTAKALTDMSVESVHDEMMDMTFWSDEVLFGTEFHYPSDLEMFSESIAGETAAEKINELSQIAIAHPESLDNLPVIIARHFGDDNLDETKRSQIRALWDSLANKDLLSFIRLYAISTAFHSPTRVKYWSSIERNLIISQMLTLNNFESYQDYYNPRGYIHDEGVRVFRPNHNVFGSQTGLEASDSPSVFKEAYNRSVDRYYYYARTTDSHNANWQKNWAAVIPADSTGAYRVKNVAEWLWQRLMADGLQNFGTLERVQVYALLGSGRDFSYFVNSSNPLKVYTAAEIDEDLVLQELYSDMSIAKMNLGSDDEDKRLAANTRVGLAVAFMAATPYAFAQVGPAASELTEDSDLMDVPDESGATEDQTI